LQGKKMTEKLKYTKKTIIELIDYEFSEFVSKYYGHDFEFLADQEVCNDSAHSFTILEKKELDKNAIEKLNKLKNNGIYMSLSRIILQDLVNKDELPAGEFIISVSW
jgi:hypothetical protein